MDLAKQKFNSNPLNKLVRTTTEASTRKTTTPEIKRFGEGRASGILPDRFTWLFLAMLVVVKLLISLILWRNSFIEYDADGFTRSLRAWDFTQHGGVLVDAWLPLQFWLNGSLFHLWPDLLAVPRIVNLTASAITTINFFFIAHRLFGRTNAYFTAMLAALFPWEIWFGLSGMSESLTNMFLSFGVLFFCGWLVNERVSNLYWAGLGLIGATALRYEAWFYSVIYVALVLLVVYRRQIWQPRLLLPLILPFIFIFYWTGLSLIQYGNPLYFVQKTSELNQRLDNQNQQVDLLGRIFFYPRTFLELAWQLTLPAILGSLLLMRKPLRVAGVYLALVWGEFLLFILTTLPFNNIAPGSQRYPVSNLLLLLPVVVYLFQWCAAQLSRDWWRLAIQAALLLLIFSQLPLIFNRQFDFPSGGVRQAAQWLKDGWKNGTLTADTIIPLDLPPTSQPDYNDMYALKVLTNHPDNFKIYQNFDTFKADITTENLPPVWVQITTALGPDGQHSVSQSDNAALTNMYGQVLQFGEVKIAYGPRLKGGQTTPKTGSASQTFQFQANGFQPGEQLDVWVSRNDNSIQTLGRFRADAAGNLTYSYKPDRDTPGHWAITAYGQTSQHYSIGRFELEP